MKNITLALAAMLFTVSSVYAQNVWSFDKSHTKIGFAVTHLLISEVEGRFKDFSGSVTSKKIDDFSDATIELTAKTGSISTDNDQRDNHLKSDDFFNAEKYPDMIFKSKSFKKGKGKNQFVVIGDLTIRDVTKEVKLDVTYNGTVKDPWGNTKAGFDLKGMINRFDYNLKWNTLMEVGGAVVGKEVKILCHIELGLNK